VRSPSSIFMKSSIFSNITPCSSVKV
jgi:hypothetical protein